MSDDESFPLLPPDEEAFVQEQIEDAIAPYKTNAPKELLDTMRATLEREIRTHPHAVAIRTELFHGKGRKGSGSVAKKPPVPLPEAVGEPEETDK